VVLFSPLTYVPEEYLKFGEDCFLLYPFQFIVLLTASLNKSEVYETERFVFGRLLVQISAVTPATLAEVIRRSPLSPQKGI
jgi:hypothetical protein